MKKSSLILKLLCVCVFLGNTYKWFLGTGDRADIFLFYDHPQGGRLVSNIVKDISDMIMLSTVLILWYYSTVYRSVKNVIMPFIIVSILDMGDYFLFYKQYSIVKLILLILLVILFNTKNTILTRLKIKASQ